MCGAGKSDISPIWNPEYFGITMVVNGRTWPRLSVEPRRYRLRLLNGCNARFLVLRLSNDAPFWVIGNDGGLLPHKPVRLTQLLMAPAERFGNAAARARQRARWLTWPAPRQNVIVDFTGLGVGSKIRLLNLGPDEPFGGFNPEDPFVPADPETTGQVLQFEVVAPRDDSDADHSDSHSTRGDHHHHGDAPSPLHRLRLPGFAQLPHGGKERVRRVADRAVVRDGVHRSAARGGRQQHEPGEGRVNVTLVCPLPTGGGGGGGGGEGGGNEVLEAFAPQSATLGIATLNVTANRLEFQALPWGHTVTEQPKAGQTRCGR